MNVPTLHLRASQSAHQHPIDSPYHDFYQCISGGSLKQALKLLQKKCNIRSSTDFMRHLFKKISKDTIEEQLSQEFDVLPDLIKKLLEEGADPNITFLSLSIGDDEYSDLTCWQVAYLYWKYLEDVGDPKEETMRTVFHLMLEVFGLNLRAKFSEQSLSDGGHFAEDTELEGEYLERITLAQYALAMGDWETCDMLISKDPTLVHETCYMTTAKGLLDEYHLLSCFNPSCHDRYCNGLSCRGLAVDELRRSVETGDIVSVIANDFRTPGTVARYGEVSFYHLAARRRDFEICFYIRGYGVDPR